MPRPSRAAKARPVAAAEPLWAIDRLDARLRACVEASGALPTAQAPVAVAFSGGLDSVVLLHRAQALWPGAVCALHINHGLQAQAAAFEAHCQRVCAQWGVPLTCAHLNLALRPGDSLEEQARVSRYQALAAAAQQVGAPTVWLAQHADDQAETILLALSRGSGVPGLAGMGARAVHAGWVFERPWLSLRRRELAAVAAALDLPFMDDPTNADTRFSRNRLRHDVLPAAERAFPSMVAALCRTARHCAQANELLAALAQEDLAAVGSPPLLAALRALPGARLANTLRAWLVAEAGRAPSTAQLDELCKQITAATTRGHHIHLRVGAGWVNRQGGVLLYTRTSDGAGCLHGVQGA